uniref:Uncharacterized protein n=1 Tax=Arundo donax TaxID=35708 RepID=A0A0A9F2R6_ARUDO
MHIELILRISCSSDKRSGFLFEDVIAAYCLDMMHLFQDVCVLLTQFC